GRELVPSASPRAGRARAERSGPPSRRDLSQERDPAARHHPASGRHCRLGRGRCRPPQDGERGSGRAPQEGGRKVSVLVAVVMGSKSDWETMEHAVETLRSLEIEHEVRVLSAHRTPDALEAFVSDVEGRGCEVFVAAAGGAAHLAGVVASKTLKPVIGVPMGSALGGLDSLLSTVQMPAGIPVATVAIGRAGAVNAALLAAAILARSDSELEGRIRAYRQKQAQPLLHLPHPTPSPLHTRP